MIFQNVYVVFIIDVWHQFWLLKYFTKILFILISGLLVILVSPYSVPEVRTVLSTFTLMPVVVSTQTNTLLSHNNIKKTCVWENDRKGNKNVELILRNMIIIKVPCYAGFMVWYIMKHISINHASSLLGMQLSFLQEQEWITTLIIYVLISILQNAFV